SLGAGPFTKYINGCFSGVSGASARRESRCEPAGGPTMRAPLRGEPVPSLDGEKRRSTRRWAMRSEHRPERAVVAGIAKELSNHATGEPPEDVTLVDGGVDQDRSARRVALDPLGSLQGRAGEPKDVGDLPRTSETRGLSMGAKSPGKYPHIDLESVGVLGRDIVQRALEVALRKSDLLLELAECRPRKISIGFGDVSAGKSHMARGGVRLGHRAL